MHQENTMPSPSDIGFFNHRPKYHLPVKRLQAFKFQLRPGGQQECEMRGFAGACRFVFHRARHVRMRMMRLVINTSLTENGFLAVEWKNATKRMA
ncbi:helix-turn-helix domain-containing protein [Shigella flexneri]